MALLAAGRFLEFFLRADSEIVAYGLVTAQWTSLALLAVAAVGAAITFAGGRPYRDAGRRRR